MDDRPGTPPDLPAVGISACLLGESVRYDGTDKRAVDLLAVLGPHVRWVALCPEVLAGLGVPRPPIRLVGRGAAVRVREVASGEDRTAALAHATASVCATVDTEDLRGFVFKARSPSCGVGDAARFADDGVLLGTGDGFVVAAVRAAHPALPVASEAEFDTPEACEAFLARVRAT